MRVHDGCAGLCVHDRAESHVPDRAESHVPDRAESHVPDDRVTRGPRG